MMVDSYAERDSLENGGEITRFRLEDGCHPLGANIFDGAAITITCRHYYNVSPINTLVIVLTLNSKCRVVLLAIAKGTILNVGE